MLLKMASNFRVLTRFVLSQQEVSLIIFVTVVEEMEFLKELELWKMNVVKVMHQRWKANLIWEILTSQLFKSRYKYKFNKAPI